LVSIYEMPVVIGKFGKQGSIRCKVCGKTIPTRDMLAHEAKHERSGIVLSGKKGVKMLGQNGAGIRKGPATAQQIMAPLVGKSGNNKLQKQLPAHLGSTREGAQWALKCLHPCGEQSGGTYGIPDRTSLQVALPEARGQLVITAPSQLTAGQTWDCVVIFPDIVEVSCVVFVKGSGQTWSTVRANLDSTTPTYTAPVINYYSLFSSTDMANDARKWRTAHGGATGHLVANSLTDQGMQYGDLAEAELVPRSADAKVGPPAFPSWSGAVYRLPLIDPSSMAERSTRLYVNNAREGVYTVRYPLEATGAMEYYDESSVPNPAPENTSRACIQFNWPDIDSVGSASSFQSGAYTSLRTRNGVSAKGGFMTGLWVWEGLDSAASVQVKTKAGIEMTTTNATIAQAFTNLSPMLDQEALDVVARVAQRAAGSYPANYNDLSKILGSIWGAVKGIAGPVVGIADHLSGMGVPVLSDVSAVVRDIGRLFV